MPRAQSISRDKVMRAVEALGLKPDEVKTLNVGAHTVTVVRYLRDRDGSFRQQHGARITEPVRLRIVEPDPTPEQ